MRVAILLCLLALAVRASAAFDVFLRVVPNTGSPGNGETADPLYAGWSSVSGFECGLNNPNDVALSRTAFLPFTLIKTVDRATPIFFDQLARGNSLGTIKMVVVLRTPRRVEMWDITCHSSYFTGQTFTGTGAELLERLSFVVGQFEWSYIQLNSAGDPINEIFANWSVLTNTGASGTRTPDFPGGIDTDGDGIPDGWELFYGLNPNVADATLDPDGDGLDNLHEYIAHTDPRVPQSVLRVTAFQPGTPGNYLLTWQSVAGLNYRIFTASAPGGPFTFLKTVPSAGNGTTSTTVGAPAGQFFYRVVTP